MNLRNFRLHDKIKRSKCLKDKNIYPSTCYSPRAGISYDNAYIDINELYKKQDEIQEDPTFAEVIDPVLGYTRKQV